MFEYMQLRNYSRATIKSYTNMVAAYARHIGKSPHLSDWEAVRAYMLHLLEVPLSATLLAQMREYWRIYRPAVFLFERSVSGGPLSVRTAQAIFQHAKAASGIQKKSPHIPSDTALPPTCWKPEPTYETTDRTAANNRRYHKE